ncbi:MAG TPA: Fe-S-containing hydro-lyase [Euryarchaeota archaeon]|nr:Fe-S-containing hydro-lyase [Euryarchaeota archaeon]
MHIKMPLTEETILRLKAGDMVELSGTVYSARDATHKKFFDALEHHEAMPFDIEGQVIYYMGPTPSPPGKIIGAAGPTTSSRMDSYTPRLLELGLKGMIGKGKRSMEVRESIVKNKAVYFVAIGGAGALAAKRIRKSQLIAYPELGPEALYKLEMDRFPLIVANDSSGNDIFELARKELNR